MGTGYHYPAYTPDIFMGISLSIHTVSNFFLPPFQTLCNPVIAKKTFLPTFIGFSLPAIYQSKSVYCCHILLLVFFYILDGYGTDAIIYLKALPSDAGELLPIFNKTSTKQYKAAIPTADWTDPGSSMNSAVHYKIGSGAMSTPIRTTVG